MREVKTEAGRTPVRRNRKRGRAAALLVWWAVLPVLCAGQHPPVKDRVLAANLREGYLTLTDSWARQAVFTAAENAAMQAGRQWEATMRKGPDDPLARRILAGGEPTFDRVASWYPGKVLDRTVLGTWSDPTQPPGPWSDEFTIWWNGAISADLFSGALTDRLGGTGLLPVAHNTNIVFRVGPDAGMYGVAGPRFSRIAYEDGYLPAVVSSYRHRGLQYRQTVFADRPAGEGGGWDIAWVRFEIANPGNAAADAELHADIHLIDGDAVTQAGQFLRNGSGALLLAHSDPATRFDPVNRRLSHRVRVPPRSRAAIVFKIPYAPDSEHWLRPATVADFDAAHARQKGFWKALLARGARVSVPELRVNDIWRALLLQNFILADGNRFTYGSGLRYNASTYPQESAFAAHTFALYGHKDYAVALQRGFPPIAITPKGGGRKYQNRRAMVFHHLLETWRLTGRRDIFDAFRDDFYRVAEEIVAERKSTMRDENGDRPLHWGWLPPDKPGADVQASTQRVYVPGHNITNCQGLMDFGVFLVRTGIDPERGNRYIREAQDFRNTLLDSMERAAIRIPGRPPFIDLQTLYTRQTPDYGPEPYDDLALGRLQGTYFHLWVDMQFHYNFFNPADPVGQWLADYVHERNGFVLGCTRGSAQSWSPYGWINSVYDGGYYNYRLRAGRIDEFLLGFYARLAYAMTRHVYVSSEGAPFIGYNTQLGGVVSADLPFPNSASNGDTLLMLRNMLAFEELSNNLETGTLCLFHGVPRRWFAGGQRIEVERFATYFGDASFSAVSRLNQGKIEVRIELARHPLLKSIAVAVRHPSAAPIRSVEIDGQAAATFDAASGIVRIPAVKDRYHLTVRY